MAQAASGSWCHRFCSHRQLLPPGFQILLLLLLLGCDLFVFAQPSKEHVLRPVNRGCQFTQRRMQLFDARPRFQHGCRCHCHFSWRFHSWIGTRRGVRFFDVHIIHELIRNSCSSRHASRSRRTLQHMSLHTQTVSIQLKRHAPAVFLHRATTRTQCEAETLSHKLSQRQDIVTHFSNSELRSTDRSVAHL